MVDLRHCEASTAAADSVFASVRCVGAVGNLALLETLGIFCVDKKKVDMRLDYTYRGFQHRHTSKTELRIGFVPV